MASYTRIFAKLTLTMAFLLPGASAQKTPSPTPTPAPTPPPPTQPGQPTQPTQPNRSLSDPLQSNNDLVQFLGGHVATNDGSTVPNDVLIQRVCLEKERQQVYASLNGDFTMQLGARNDSFTDASVDTGLPYGENRKNSDLGIPRRELTNCDLRVTASGFYSRVVSLAGLDPSIGRIDVGSIVLQRAGKIEGATLNAAVYKAPREARKAYEKGLAAAKNANTNDARKYFQQAVRVCPGFAEAWFQLGAVSEQANDSAAARSAYLQATSINPKYPQPYLSLARMALKDENWVEARDISNHILDLDPLNRTNITGGIWDLDPSNSADAYFYNALANFKLNHFEQAERSALKARERVDLNGRYPQLHLILADVFTRKSNYAGAASEIEMYLELVPHAPNADQLRQRTAELKKLSATKAAN